MSKVGNTVKLKIRKIVKNGVYLEREERKEEYFLHIKEISNEYVKNIDDLYEIGQEIECRIIGNRFNRGRKTVRVSVRLLDEKLYQKETFDEKLENFLKRSSEKQREIRKNNERKIMRTRPKNNNKKHN